MEVEKTPIEGVLLIKPRVFRDERGYFVETWQEERYVDAGITMPFVQDNLSASKKGIVRGLHFQKKYPQGKLVSVSLGEVFDVIVDIRPESKTFGCWYGAVLTQDNQYQMWIPPGMAHGFAVLSDCAHFHYKCTDVYHPEDEGAIRWNDPVIGIEWPLGDFAGAPVVSAKDAAAPFFKDIEAELRAKH